MFGGIPGKMAEIHQIMLDNTIAKKIENFWRPKFMSQIVSKMFNAIFKIVEYRRQNTNKVSLILKLDSRAMKDKQMTFFEELVAHVLNSKRVLKMSKTHGICCREYLNLIDRLPYSNRQVKAELLKNGITRTELWTLQLQQD